MRMSFRIFAVAAISIYCVWAMCYIAVLQCRISDRMVEIRDCGSPMHKLLHPRLDGWGPDVRDLWRVK
jgi:hypothetical protein